MMMREPYYDDGRVTLYLGDALEVARDLPSESVSCIVTSPPYYGLRDYEIDGQYGDESTVHEYCARLAGLFHELRRVLERDGTLWLNLGDSWASRWSSVRARSALHMPDDERQRRKTPAGFVDKQLMGVPWRVAFALQDTGWILRSDIIWAKPNPVPESVSDRPTKSHEHVFLFAKSKRYHYDAEAIAEPAVMTPQRRRSPGSFGRLSGIPGQTPQTGQRRLSAEPVRDSETRNARDVWEIATTPHMGAHFAVFPNELPRRCIRAGAKPGGVVLDPFSGSGTTGEIALQEGHRYVGIDLNPAYLDQSLRERFAQQPLDIDDGIRAGGTYGVPR